MADLKKTATKVVTRLAARGEGVTADNQYVPGAITGDMVDEQGEILPGPNRVQIACQHFGDCGGCSLQMASDDLLKSFARDRVVEPLQRVGIEPAEILPTHLSPAKTRRRAALRATRTNGEVRIGFNAAGEHRIVDLHDCQIMHADLFALLEPLRKLLGPYLAEKSAISVTLTVTDSGVDMLLGNLQANTLPEIEGLTEFAESHGLARLSIDSQMGIETVVALHDPAINMAGVPVTLPPAAFLQATADGEAALVAAVKSIIGKSKKVADLFSGCGTFTFPLVGRGKMIAADGTGPAIRALETAGKRAGLLIETQHRDLFRKPLSPEELNVFDAVVIDPPRAGAQAQMANLALSKVPVIAAVSCNPATFARDAEMLIKGGYKLKRIWPVAQFRWSTHVELVAEFKRK